MCPEILACSMKIHAIATAAFFLIVIVAQSVEADSTPILSAGLSLSDDGTALELEIYDISHSNVRSADTLLVLQPPGGPAVTHLFSEMPWNYSPTIRIDYSGNGTYHMVSRGDLLTVSFPATNEPRVGKWGLTIGFSPIGLSMYSSSWTINGSEVPGDFIPVTGAGPIYERMPDQTGEITVALLLLVAIAVVFFLLARRSRAR